MKASTCVTSIFVLPAVVEVVFLSLYVNLKVLQNLQQ